MSNKHEKTSPDEGFANADITEVESDNPSDQHTKSELPDEPMVPLDEAELKVWEYLKNKDSLIEQIETQGLEALRNICADIYGDYWHEYGFETAWDEFVKTLLSISTKTGNSSADAIQACDKQFCTNEEINFRQYVHSLCHLFEGYKSDFIDEPIRKESFLYHPDTFSDAMGLVDEAVKRSVEARSDDNMIRIIEPILRYNLDNLDLSDLDSNFPFKPSSFTNTEFIKLFGAGEYATLLPEIVKFMEAESPRQFLILIIESGIEPRLINLRANPELQSAIKSDVDSSAWESYFGKSEETNAADSKEVEELVDAFFVDVEGTLINNDGTLNTNVLAELENAESRYQVIIFTGSDIKETTEKLRSLGVPERFLPVRSKQDYKGKILGVLLDDTPPSSQGFKSKEYIQP